MKLQVVVPYRDRPKQLRKFVPGLSEYLTSQKIDFSITVVNQLGVGPLNRGKLKNIGFLETPEKGYTVFHDVDLFPIRRKVEPDHFGYHGMPNYMALDHARSIAKPAQRCAGCIFAVGNPAFEKVNGFSNSYWGWGYEDMDLWYRLQHYKIQIDEQGKRVSKGYGKAAFTHLDKGTGWAVGHERNKAVLDAVLMNREKNYKSDGLNTCLYRVEKKHEQQGYTMIDVIV